MGVLNRLADLNEEIEPLNSLGSRGMSPPADKDHPNIAMRRRGVVWIEEAYCHLARGGENLSARLEVERKPVSRRVVHQGQSSRIACHHQWLGDDPGRAARRLSPNRCRCRPDHRWP